MKPTKPYLCLLLTLTLFAFAANATGNKEEFSSAFRSESGSTQASSSWEEWGSWFTLPDLGELLLNLIKGRVMTDGSTGDRPIQAPDVFQCRPAELPPHARPMTRHCCIPPNSTIIDYVLPAPPSTLRIRQPAHTADPAFIAKYEKAIALMKALPDEDPRSFNNQARIHCAYCNHAYSQQGFPDLDLQIHGSWLFLPWHRFFLYFHERILGSLIGDPTFAIPFWNWDSPLGMPLPLIYAANSSSPLYNPTRAANHQPSTGRVVDLDFNGKDESPLTAEEQTDHNLKLMYRQMVSNGKTTSLFMGSPYRNGDAPISGSSGSLETAPHGQVHYWTGDGTQPNREDMGTFYTAAFDPIFFAHHGNLDRLWHVWKSFEGKKNYEDEGFLEASFLFYDENAQLVRVKIKDSLDVERMGYGFQDLELPWLTARPTAATSLKNANAEMMTTVPSFPVKLDKAVSMRLKRSRVLRRLKDKEREEVLVVEGIEADMGEYVKFDVYVNAPAGLEGVTVAASEFAGSFVSLPHVHRRGSGMSMRKTVLRLGITDLLEDLGAEFFFFFFDGNLSSSALEEVEFRVNNNKLLIYIPLRFKIKKGKTTINNTITGLLLQKLNY